MLHQLFLKFIFTGKPKTKYQVAKKGHRPIKGCEKQTEAQVSVPCKCSAQVQNFLKICAGFIKAGKEDRNCFF